MMSDKLLRCPFCGGEATYWINNAGGISVGCLTNYRDIDHPRCPAEPIVTKFSRDVETAKEEAIKAWNTRPNPWHTGTPTEEGWYLLHYPKCKEQPYELAQWSGEHFVAVKPFHAIIVRIDADTVPYWQKIEPCKENDNG